LRPLKTEKVMRMLAKTELRGWLRAAATVFVLSASALVVSCSGIGLNDDRPDDISQDYFKRPEYCPVVRIRPGTESITVYERGHDGDPQFVRYQASITKTARECASTSDGFTVKVGGAGRVVAGPKGGPATVTLPLRVVLTQQSGGVRFSELYRVTVTLAPPTYGGSFSQVVESISVTAAPNERDFIIYVGFDEGNTG
jgi:hypothetical protein